MCAFDMRLIKTTYVFTYILVPGSKCHAQQMFVCVCICIIMLVERFVLTEIKIVIIIIIIYYY